MNGTSIRKSEYVSKSEKNVFFARKMVTLFQNSVVGEIQFSQKSLTRREKQPHNPSTTSPCATNPYNLMLLLEAPQSAEDKIRNFFLINLIFFLVSRVETKIRCVRGDRDSRCQNESPIPDLSTAPKFVSLARVVGDINDVNFLKNAKVN